jgi:hypothetical protein
MGPVELVGGVVHAGGVIRAVDVGGSELVVWVSFITTDG